MQWSMEWLRTANPDDLEALHNDCRLRAKENYRAGRFGLWRAWDGLAHEVLMQMLYLAELELEVPGQLQLEVSPPGAYDGRHV